MYTLARTAGVPLEPLDALRSKGPNGYEYLIPEGLMELVNTVRQQGNQSPAYERLYREYIHHSHQYAPVLSPYLVEEGEKRKIYPNRNSNAITDDAQIFDFLFVLC